MSDNTIQPKIAIIGSGPAGLTAAIYTSRASLDTTVFMGMQPGGQLTTTTEIENFPGFVDGIDGGELMENMQKQAERFGSKMIRDEVRNIEVQYPHTRILFATHNPSKVNRLQEYVKVNNLELVGLSEITNESFDVEEVGNDEIENAKLKAKSYYDKFGIATLSLDTGLYFDGVEDSEQPRKSVQGIAGAGHGESDEQRYELMISWYSNLAKKYNNKLDGYFLDVYVIYDGAEYFVSTAKRNITLTSEVHSKDVHFPIASLYHVNGVYHHEMTKDQELAYLKPSMDCVNQLLINFQQKNPPKIILQLPGENMEFDGVVIASGASAKYIGIEGEEKFVGKGYHSCATCDGFFYRKKEIIMVGGGDSAMEEAGFLTKFASKVHLFHRSDKFRASKIMLDRAKNNPKIEFHTFVQIVGFLGDEKVEGVIIENTLTKAISNMPIDGVFVAIGHTPNTSFVAGKLPLDESGYVGSQSQLDSPKRVSKYLSQSNIPGVFVAGDVQDKVYRQAITAAGEGCKAAMDLEKWLEEVAN